LQGSANEVNMMLGAVDILDQRGTDNVICGGDIDQKGLMSIRFMEDRWWGEGGFKILEYLFTIIIPRELGGFFEVLYDGLGLFD